MFQKILHEQDLSSSFETNWVQLIYPSNEARKKIAANTLVISWEGASGELLDGKITIIGASEKKFPAIGSTIFINKPNTEIDCWVFKLVGYVNSLKIIYESNSISGGKISASIEFN